MLEITGKSGKKTPHFLKKWMIKWLTYEVLRKGISMFGYLQSHPSHPCLQTPLFPLMQEPHSTNIEWRPMGENSFMFPQSKLIVVGLKTSNALVLVDAHQSGCKQD